MLGKPFTVFLLGLDGGLQLVVSLFNGNLGLDFIDIRHIIKQAEEYISRKAVHGQAFFECIGQGFLWRLLVCIPVALGGVVPDIRGVTKMLDAGTLVTEFNPKRQPDGVRQDMAQNVACCVVHRGAGIGAFLHDFIAPLDTDWPPLLGGQANQIGCIN